MYKSQRQTIRDLKKKRDLLYEQQRGMISRDAKNSVDKWIKEERERIAKASEKRQSDKNNSIYGVILLALLLTSCTKEYSYETTCIEYTTINWEDGETMKSWRQVDRPLRNDTSYFIGSARPAVVIVKTECK